MAQILPIAAIAMQAGGQLFQGFSAAGQARNAARIDDENARLALLGGEQDVYAIRRAERRAAGDALTEMAGSGVLTGTGSAADVIAASAAAAELDIAARRTQAMGEERNFKASAAAQRSAAKGAVIGGVFGAVSTALSGAAGMKNQSKLKTQAQWSRAFAMGGGRPGPMIAAPGATPGYNPWAAAGGN
jgi:hypothetical protein